MRDVVGRIRYVLGRMRDHDLLAAIVQGDGRRAGRLMAENARRFPRGVRVCEGVGVWGVCVFLIFALNYLLCFS